MLTRKDALDILRREAQVRGVLLVVSKTAIPNMIHVNASTVQCAGKLVYLRGIIRLADVNELGRIFDGTAQILPPACEQLDHPTTEDFFKRRRHKRECIVRIPIRTKLLWVQRCFVVGSWQVLTGIILLASGLLLCLSILSPHVRGGNLTDIWKSQLLSSLHHAVERRFYTIIIWAKDC